MQKWEPSFDPNNNSENTQNLVDRFIKVGWITGENLVTPSWSRLSFSAKGKERIGAAAHAWRAAWPDFFSGDPANLPQKTPMEQLEQFIKLGPVFLELHKIAVELQPPAFTAGQVDTLNGMILHIAMHGFPGEKDRWEHPGRG